MVTNLHTAIFRSRYVKSIAFCVVLSQTTPFRGQSQSVEPISQSITSPLPNVDSHFDHFGVDVSDGRPHAVLYAPAVNRLFITDGDHSHGKVHVQDGTTYALLSDIEIAPGAEQLSWDPRKQMMYAGNGGQDAQQYAFISVIGAATSSKVGDIRIETPSLEATALETKTGRLHANDRLNIKFWLWSDASGRFSPCGPSRILR